MKTPVAELNPAGGRTRRNRGGLTGAPVCSHFRPNVLMPFHPKRAHLCLVFPYLYHKEGFKPELALSGAARSILAFMDWGREAALCKDLRLLVTALRLGDPPAPHSSPSPAGFVCLHPLVYSLLVPQDAEHTGLTPVL